MSKTKGLLIGASCLALAACGQMVQPGYVGIQVNQYGSNAGVDPTPLGTGRYWPPFGSNIVEYPVYTKIYTFTASTDEQSGKNEEFVFQDKSGLNISADVAVSYSVNPQLAPTLYKKYRSDSDQIMEGQVRNAIRNAFVNTADQVDIQQIYGGGKQQLLSQVQKLVHDQFAPYGLNIEGLSYAGPMRFPQSVIDQITARTTNEQQALAAQAAVATATAKAQARVAQAQGEAQANTLLAASIKANPEIVQLKAIEKWDGVLPVYNGGGSMPFIGDIRSKQ